MIAVKQKRPGKVYHHPMAKAFDSRDVRAVKCCEHCGASPLVREQKRFCSTACANHSRKDHSPETLMKRFWRKVDQQPGQGPNGDCWQWTARRDGHGYGEIKVAGAYKKAHRLALFGPAGMNDPRLACHTCDNPACVRTDHLFAGTSLDNVRDMIAKGRKTSLKGRSFKKKAA